MKPLKDWTLKEVQEHCKNFFNDNADEEAHCIGCKLQKICWEMAACNPCNWNLKPPTYKEEIEWHSYPEEEPSFKGSVLVRFKDGYVAALYSDSLNATDAEVIEWAEMPKGHNKEIE